MHKEITTTNMEGLQKIYSVDKAEMLYKQGKVGYRKLSLMKHENIKEAIDSGYPLKDIRYAAKRMCGYCFKFPESCIPCTLYPRNGGSRCTNGSEWDGMMNARNRKQFRVMHEAWLIRLGLNVYPLKKKK